LRSVQARSSLKLPQISSYYTGILGNMESSINNKTILRNFCEKKVEEVLEEIVLDGTETFVNESDESNREPQQSSPVEDEVEEMRTETTAHEFKAETRKLLDIVAKS